MIDKMKFNKEYVQRIGVFVTLITLTFLFLLDSPFNIWRKTDFETDSSVFRNVAFLMSKGYMPYRDTFDHKGPLLYLINFIGIHISYYNGVRIIELLVIFVTFLFIYNIARLYCHRFYSIALLVIAIMLLCCYYGGGNFTEEYAMPFLSMALYIFIDYFKNSRITKFRLIICGISFGAVCLLRPNMISVWIVFSIAVLISCVSKKQFLELRQFICWFMFGFSIIVLPIILWLVANNSFDDFIKDYIVFNILYSSSKGGHVISRRDTFMTFFTNKIVIITFICSASLLLIKRELLYMAYVVYLFVTLLLLCMSGQVYGHYGMVLVPAVVFPMASFWAMIKFDVKWTKKLIVGLIFICVLSLPFLSVFILPKCINFLNKVKTMCASKSEERYPEIVSKVCSYIVSNTSEEETISVYGNWNVIYVLSQRVSASKYSYQVPIGQVMPSIMDEYFNELEEKMPKIIIIEGGVY